LKRRDIVSQSGARTAGLKENLKKEPVALDDNKLNMPSFEKITEKCPRINFHTEKSSLTLKQKT